MKVIFQSVVDSPIPNMVLKPENWSMNSGKWVDIQLKVMRQLC